MSLWSAHFLLCHRHYGKSNQNQKSLYWFTTRTNGLRTEKYSKVLLISTFSARDGRARKLADGSMSMDTKEGDWVNPSLMYLKTLEATLMIVMSFPSGRGIHSPMAIELYSYFCPRDRLSIEDRDVFWWWLMHTCCCVALESAWWTSSLVTFLLSLLLWLAKSFFCVTQDFWSSLMQFI